MGFGRALRAFALALQASLFLVIVPTIIVIPVLAWKRADVADGLIIAAVASMVVTTDSP